MFPVPPTHRLIGAASGLPILWTCSKDKLAVIKACDGTVTIEALTHYRLRIATGRAATTFCITAASELDANRKAAAIVKRLNAPSAKILLTTRDGAARRPAGFAELAAPSYWGA